MESFRLWIKWSLLGLVALCVAGFVTLYVLSTWSAEPTNECDVHFDNGVVLSGVPAAQTRPQQIKGLSKQARVDKGMLFAWNAAEPRTFWMHDTWAPLSVGFFSDEGVLFSIDKMSPNTDTHHDSESPARFALELPQGRFEQLNLKTGSKVTHMACRLIN